MDLLVAVVFWVSLLACVFIYAGFPLLLRAWGACVPSRIPPPSDAPLPRTTLLISAYNESAVIEAKVANALTLEYPPGQLTVALVSDGSTDDTVARARATAAAAGPHTQHRFEVFDFAARRGKNAALNEAIAATTGDLLVFTDANTEYAPDAVARLARHFADPAVGVVVGQLRFRSAQGDTVDGGLYWRLETRLKRLQDTIGSVLVANGTIFAARRGTFGPLYDDIANDFQIPMEASGGGYAVRFEPEAVAIEKAASDQDEEFARKVRIVTRGMTGAWRLRRHIRGKRLLLLCMHKVLRWGVGGLQGLLLATSLWLAGTSPLYALALAAQVAFYALAGLGFALRRSTRAPLIVRVPYYFCMVNAAAMVAAWRFLRGRRVTMWDKAESAR